ncbi:MAG: phenylacetate-CoA oxygenase subunit PaaC [Saprospiraceae bacterium]|nr:phenylacetate-CoA oxygenase subunit PaaC [Saprospiraceae bacterium]
MTLQQAHFEYLLRLGDNALILGQRLSEWCGHGPVLEQDIAITNISLDLIGQARSLLEYAGKLEGKGRTEDDLAFLRDAWDFRNVLLVEQPNQDWAFTIVRQFFFDAFHYPLLEQLTESKDEHLAAIAKKSIKEVAYHLRYSSEWMIRLGDGTEVSHKKMQTALDELWMFSGEFAIADEVDLLMATAGIGANMDLVQQAYLEKTEAILLEATLQKPTDDWMQRGGKTGTHTEHLGFILAEMQFMQRAYPGQKW